MTALFEDTDEQGLTRSLGELLDVKGTTTADFVGFQRK